MFRKLKQFWCLNKREVKAGLGSGLSLLGVLLLIKSFPAWILETLIGGLILGAGIKLLKTL